MQYREIQWSFVGEGPPFLSRNTFAYRFGGFGTHENVVYYDLLRFLIRSCLECVDAGKIINPVDEATRLEQLKSDWLDQPQPDFSGRIPALIIENERRRLPLTMSGKEMVIDEDCPTCQMMGEGLGMGPGFWHLDGSGMDDDFPFSSYSTREEWEAEKRQWEELSAEFERQRAERQLSLDDEAPGSGDELSDLIQ